MNTDQFQEKTTSYIVEMSQKSQAFRDMYLFNAEYENIPANTTRDILLEKKLSPVKGVVHKFPNRVAVLLSFTCAANCRYCERQDRVGVGLDKIGRLKNEDIDMIINYLSDHTEIDEVILTGGDPLTHIMGLLYFCEKVQYINHIKVVRIHTRFPLQMPDKVNFQLLEKIVHTKPVFYFSIHVNHPDELNEITLPILNNIRKLGFIMLSQSVFLKGVNDNADTLKILFNTLNQNGIRPYYIYHCQSIPTTSRFVTELADEVRIMSELRSFLSGTAYPDHVIDIQNAVGKIIVPTNHWNVDYSTFIDFQGTECKL